MGQSKQPAKCVICGLEGPPRGKKALQQGWYSRGGLKPEWYCPEHAGAVKAADEMRLRDAYLKIRRLGSLGAIGLQRRGGF